MHAWSRRVIMPATCHMRLTVRFKPSAMVEYNLLPTSTLPQGREICKINYTTLAGHI